MIFISIDKTDFKTKSIVRDKVGYYITIKGSIHTQDITLVNINAPNKGAPKYMQKNLIDIKEEIDRNSTRKWWL